MVDTVRKLGALRIPGGHPLSLLCVVLAAGCAAGLGRKPRASAAAGSAAAPAGPHFPNQDLAAKHEAARRAPKDFDVVMLYASALTNYCLASLVDVSCGPACTSGPLKYKPASALDGNGRQLVEGALPLLDGLMSVQGLSWDRMGQWAAVKGRLLGLSGRAADEQTLIDGYALQHPDAVPVVRRRLELLRELHDAKGAEAQCTGSRASLKLASDPVRLELLTSCVSLHPANDEGRTDPLDFAKYLPKLTKDEQRLYRQHMAQRCEQNTLGKEAPCGRLCTCNESPADKRLVADCKEACKRCREQATARLKLCKKVRAR
jgi:hypothetical protein